MNVDRAEGLCWILDESEINERGHDGGEHGEAIMTMTAATARLRAGRWLSIRNCVGRCEELSFWSSPDLSFFGRNVSDWLLHFTVGICFVDQMRYS